VNAANPVSHLFPSPYQGEVGWGYLRRTCCKRAKLVVEIDGDSHYSEEGIAHDARRSAYLRRLSFRVLRFNNGDVLEGDDGVFDILRQILGEPDSSPPPTRGRSGGGVLGF
jgi:very-short-patch-repair endonuclease